MCKFPSLLFNGVVIRYEIMIHESISDVDSFTVYTVYVQRVFRIV